MQRIRVASSSFLTTLLVEWSPHAWWLRADRTGHARTDLISTQYPDQGALVVVAVKSHDTLDAKRGFHRDQGLLGRLMLCVFDRMH